MKTRTLIQAAVIAAMVAAPALSFAQSASNNASKTRAEVRAELIQLERAGYNPATADNTNYPVDLQAAEARVSQGQHGADATGYGPGTAGSTQSGQ